MENPAADHCLHVNLYQNVFGNSDKVTSKSWHSSELPSIENGEPATTALTADVTVEVWLNKPIVAPESLQGREEVCLTFISKRSWSHWSQLLSNRALGLKLIVVIDARSFCDVGHWGDLTNTDTWYYNGVDRQS